MQSVLSQLVSCPQICGEFDNSPSSFGTNEEYFITDFLHIVCTNEGSENSLASDSNDKFLNETLLSCLYAYSNDPDSNDQSAALVKQYRESLMKLVKN
jgi:hypothetical protein